MLCGHTGKTVPECDIQHSKMYIDCFPSNFFEIIILTMSSHITYSRMDPEKLVIVDKKVCNEYMNAINF